MIQLLVLTPTPRLRTENLLTPTPRLTWRERLKAQRHIRPHVNPLQRRFVEQDCSTALNDAMSFEKLQPLHVDIGCGKGHFCADLATARPDLNVLGIEIREELMVEARRLSELSGVGNLRFVSGSANALVPTLPNAQLLSSASVNFPDPWPKRRHRKRRVVQPECACLRSRNICTRPTPALYNCFGSRAWQWCTPSHRASSRG